MMVGLRAVTGASILIIVCLSASCQSGHVPAPKGVSEVTVSVAGGESLRDDDPAPVLSPEEALKSFVVASGFQVEVVASEPLIHDPVAIDFDADGRMYVVEMRSYMPNVEGEGELTPNGRVVVLEDLDGDGRMDRCSVFLDSLVQPRAVKALDRGVLVGEPPYLWLARDTDGDLRADVKEIVRADYGRRESNAERNPNGLIWTMDNWILNVWWDRQLRIDARGSWEAIRTLNRGQWNLTHDDFGRVFRNSNEQPLHVDVIPAYYFARNPSLIRTRGAFLDIVEDKRVWPIRPTPGVNRGYREGILREDGTLHRFTAAGSPVAYRGDRYPAQFRNDIFVTEPAANLVRRFVVDEAEDGGKDEARDGAEYENEGGSTPTLSSLAAENAYEQAEFLASTDERFRPVNLYSAPDGTLYVVDMYRGIIQHRQFLTEFLEAQIEDRALDDPIGLGRIYRLVHESSDPGPKPGLSVKNTHELIKMLSHPNGWWRDTAQRLLVERGDSPSAAPPLRDLLMSTSDTRIRLHALWTLDGLGSTRIADVLHALSDDSHHVRMAGLRMAEGFADDPKIKDAVRVLMADEMPAVQRQLTASIGEFPAEDRLPFLEEMVVRYGDDPVIVDAAVSGLHTLEEEFLQRLLSHREDPILEDALTMTTAALLKSGGGFGLVFASIGDASRPSWQRTSIIRAILAITREDGEPLMVDTRPEGLFAAAASDDDSDQDDAEDQDSSDDQVDAGEAAMRELASTALRRVSWPGKPQREQPAVLPLTDEEQVRFNAGEDLYAVICAACHGYRGEGGEGKPLAGSRWASGEKDPLIRIVLHGKEGERLMPPMRQLSDDDVASILTFIRRSWGNQAQPVSRAEVHEVRGRTAFRDRPWTEEELDG
jgi:mono/diheme cytochrome c family protein/glucose/arabinose dehydrogenase